MKERGESYRTLVDNHGLDTCTICPVLSGKANVRIKFAQKTAEALKTDINILFDVQEIKQPYAYYTNHHIKATVRAILSFAKKKRIVADNYATAEYIDFPKATQKDIVCMGENEVKDAYKAIQTHKDIRHGTALLTLVFTGFRRGELCGLRWENIDLVNRLITVNKSVVRTKKRGQILKEPKTKKSKRTVEIPYILAEQLIKYKEWYYKLKAEMGDRWDNDDWVFINTDNGKRIAADTILAWVNKVTKGAGLGYWNVHSYRHTNITTKLLNNVPLLEVSGEAGHSRTSTTTDRYGHLLAAHKRVGPQVFDNFFAPAAEPGGENKYPH